VNTYYKDEEGYSDILTGSPVTVLIFKKRE